MTWSSAAAVTTCFSGRVATTPWWAVPAGTTATGARTPTQRSGARQRGASHNDVARLRGPALGHRGADAHSPRLDSTGPAVSMAVDGPQRRFRAAGLERAVLARRPRARAQAKALRLPFDPLDEAPEDPGLWSEVPLELLVRFACVPVGRDGRRLVLAFGGLDDLLKVDELEFLLERPIDAVVAPADRVAALLRRRRGGEVLLEQASEGLRLQLLAEDETEAVDLASLPGESPIVRFEDSLILGAIDRRASDIHVETKDREVLVKYRIDGVLYPALDPLDKRHHDTIISRLKVMSELDIEIAVVRSNAGQADTADFRQLISSPAESLLAASNANPVFWYAGTGKRAF